MAVVFLIQIAWFLQVSGNWFFSGKGKEEDSGGSISGSYRIFLPTSSKISIVCKNCDLLDGDSKT